jgi:hypothetical protein
MPTPSIAHTRIVARPEDAFERFPRLTRLAAIAEIVERRFPGTDGANVWQALASEEFHEVTDRTNLTVALDLVREGSFLVRYGRALAWLEVPR